MDGAKTRGARLSSTRKGPRELTYTESLLLEVSAKSLVLGAAAGVLSGSPKLILGSVVVMGAASYAVLRRAS